MMNLKYEVQQECRGAEADYWEVKLPDRQRKCAWALVELTMRLEIR